VRSYAEVRVTAVLQLHPGQSVTGDEIKSFVKARVGSVKMGMSGGVNPGRAQAGSGQPLRYAWSSACLCWSRLVGRCTAKRAAAGAHS
jgi:hypothetical protein